MIEQIRLHKAELEKMRNQIFGLDIARLNKKIIKNGRIKGPIIPTVGDLVMIRHPSKPGQDKYGVIDEIIYPQTIKIRTRTGMIERPAAITVPLVPNCIMKSGELRTMKVKP
jgi:hypothetical protein